MLDSTGVSRRVVRFAGGARVFAQGRLAASVFYIQSGQVNSRVDFFMNKFRKLGVIEYNGGLKIHCSAGPAWRAAATLVGTGLTATARRRIGFSVWRCGRPRP